MWTKLLTATLCFPNGPNAAVLYEAQIMYRVIRNVASSMQKLESYVFNLGRKKESVLKNVPNNRNRFSGILFMDVRTFSNEDNETRMINLTLMYLCMSVTS